LEGLLVTASNAETLASLTKKENNGERRQQENFGRSRDGEGNKMPGLAHQGRGLRLVSPIVNSPGGSSGNNNAIGNNTLSNDDENRPHILYTCNLHCLPRLTGISVHYTTTKIKM
jgi:hypothetical protein